jgi:hypothetical protein
MYIIKKSKAFFAGVSGFTIQALVHEQENSKFYTALG